MEHKDQLRIQANMLFFYYKNLDAAVNFYEQTLGLEVILDYGFAKVFKVSQSLFLGLVDEQRGMHRADEPKTVTLSFVTDQIDGWYAYLTEAQVKIHRPLGDSSRLPIRGFVAKDPEGYFLEFETFLEHEQNEKLLPRLSKIQDVLSPEGQNTSRPVDLGIRANVIWLYYKDLEEAQRFHEDKLGLNLLVDQGFAKVYTGSKSAFVGLVDEAHGLHRFSEEKAVTLSFISDQIDDWYRKLLDMGLEMRDELADSETIPVRSFVTYDIAGYFIEFDWFLDHVDNERILNLLE